MSFSTHDNSTFLLNSSLKGIRNAVSLFEFLGVLYGVISPALLPYSGLMWVAVSIYGVGVQIGR
ncbi:MAG: hypothetical protein Q9M44_07560, partial [Ghiorsea sp.]|nr:hypothetical protein [Ghiorsea sp.]